MAGVQATAGRLSIEILADVARLQNDMNRVRQAVKSASSDIAASARHANDNLAGVGRSSRLAGHHVQNLSFQLQDIVIGLKGGQKPMTVFMQQGSQIAQIMSQAGIGVGGLAKEIGGMAGRFALAHPVLLAVSAAAGLVAGALALVTSEINKTSDVTVTWQDVMLGAFDVVSAAASDQVTAAFDAMGLDIGKVWDWIVETTKTAANLIIGAATAVPRLIAATYDKIGPAIGDAFYSGANLAIRALNMLAQMSAAPLNLIIDGLNNAFGTDIPRIVMDSISEIANPYEGAMQRLGSAGAAALTDTFSKDYIGGIAGALSEAAQARARAREAAEKAGKDLGKAGGAAAGKEAAKEFAMSFAEAFKDVADYAKAIEAVAKDNAGLDKRLASLKRELSVLGLVGKERAKALKLLEDEAELAELTGRLAVETANARVTGQWQIVEGLQKQIDKLREIHRLENDIADFADQQDANAEATARANAQLSDMADLLSRIGGAGSVLGSILAIASGDYNSVAQGPVGDILALALNLQTGWTKDKDGKLTDIPRLLGDELRDVFDENGVFGMTLTKVFAGAGLGYASASAVGMTGTGSGIGSAIGGAIGHLHKNRTRTKSPARDFALLSWTSPQHQHWHSRRAPPSGNSKAHSFCSRQC